MTVSEIEALSRAHQLFAGGTRTPTLDAGPRAMTELLKRTAGLNSGVGQRRYQLAGRPTAREALQSAARTDAEAAASSPAPTGIGPGPVS